MRYEVFVDDNFHAMDESERYRLGEFATSDEAVAACRRIVDEFFARTSPGKTAEELLTAYRSFGEDPWIRTDDPSCRFSAWDYAKDCAAARVRQDLEREPAAAAIGPALNEERCSILLEIASESALRAHLARAMPDLSWEESDSSWDKVRVTGTSANAWVQIYRYEEPGPFTLTIRVHLDGAGAAAAAVETLRARVLAATVGTTNPGRS